MGRWGNEIYQSDGALDYFSTITDRIEREFAFQFSPEQVTAESWWVNRVLTVLEVTLLLHRHTYRNILFSSTVASVQRWQKIFFEIWDGEWKSDRNPTFHDPEHRKAKRYIAMMMFSQVEGIARSWENHTYDEIDFGAFITPFSNESISRLKNRDNIEVIAVERFTGELIEIFVKDIIYWLSTEKRSLLLGFFGSYEDPIVAADLLACLCEAYQTNPLIDYKAIQNWRKTYFEVMKQAYEEDDLKLDETDAHFKAIVAIFDKLEALAQQYPPEEW